MKPKIIAVTKTHPMTSILPLLNYGHLDYGENKVQEALEKWIEIKNNKNINLHLIGRLQTNKVKFALKIFDYIHSLDNEKLATKIADEQAKQSKKPKSWEGKPNTVPNPTQLKKLRKIQSTSQNDSESKEHAIDLPLGTKVEHQRFGKGIVTLIEGVGNDKKATIKFNGTGDKKLLLRFAKLKIID